MSKEYSGVLLNIDSVPDLHRDVYAKECSIMYPYIVPVLLNFDMGNILGGCSITRENDKLYYRIHLNKQAKELRNKVENLVPCIGGEMKKEGNIINWVTITAVSLEENPCDIRLNPLKHYTEPSKCNNCSECGEPFVQKTDYYRCLKCFGEEDNI